MWCAQWLRRDVVPLPQIEALEQAIAAGQVVPSNQFVADAAAAGSSSNPAYQAVLEVREGVSVGGACMQ